ncbi:hypothetical protein PANDA_001839, partial [Ailuropoda melanoleuca]
SGPVGWQENHAWPNPAGASLQPAMIPELQELNESPPFPRIVSAYSLQPSVIPGSSAPGLAVLSYDFNEGGEGATGDLPSAPPLALPTALLYPGDPHVVHSPEMANRSAVWGHSHSGPDQALAFCIPPDSEMPEESETSQENSCETIYYPALLGSINGPGTDSSSVSLPPNFAFEKVVLAEMPEKEETSLENSSQTVYYQTSSGNDSGPALDSSSLSIPPNYESSTEMSSETMSSSTVMKNDNGQDTDSESFFLAPGFVLLPIEILVKAENSVENVPEIMNYPTVLEKDNSQDSVSSSFCVPSSFGYLGDPKRNVKVLNVNLVAAKKKTHPRHAARYLVHLLFSKEVLMHSWVGVNSQGRQPLDPNKMAAIREYLAANFPKYDLSERGKDWKTCVADINSLIYCLCAEADTTPKTGGSNKGPASLGIPASAVLNGRRGDEAGESSSRLSRRTAASETRENGNSQWNSSVCPQGIIEPSIENSVVSYEALEYLGNPGRNIRLPHSVLNVAKGKSRPELAARYLIRNLFTEEVLIKSNVYGNMGHGMYALNPNRINALREFLQEIYPTCSLSETGYDWKLCVTAINSSIRSLRYDLKKSTSK